MPIIDRLFRSLSISASGMSAQSRRMDIIAQNLANASTTRTDAGGPYQRQIVELAGVEAIGTERAGAHLSDQELSIAAQRHFRDGKDMDDLMPMGYGVEVLGIALDPSEGPRIYDPGHPDADESGYVQMPNVDTTTEMVDMMEARRLWEANASAFEAAKSILKTSVDL